MSEKIDITLDDPSTSSLEGQNTVVADEDSWTTKTSTKSRRLAPQCILSRTDLAESPRSKTTNATGQEISKKKVIRFTKEEILNMRSDTRVLPRMIELTDIVSIDALTPICLETFEAEDVYRLWNADRVNKDGSASRGRGRGRGRGDDEDNGGNGSWTRGSAIDSSKGLWDDVTSGNVTNGDGLDLADFAAMALKFRSETKDLGENLESFVNEEDAAMDRLMREQDEILDTVDDGEDNDVPEWDDVPTNEVDYASTGSGPKRSMLLDALHVKKFGSENLEKKSIDNFMEKSLEIQPIMNLSRISMDSLLGGSKEEKNLSYGGVVEHKQPVPIVIIDEWFYLDPNNKIQGPFDTESMRRWYEFDYFKNDLPIKMQVWNTFYPLGLIFPTAGSGFREIPPEPNQAKNNYLLEQQKEQQRQQQLELERQRQEKALALEQQHKQSMLEQQMSIQQQERMLEHQRAEQMRQEQHRQEQQRQEQQKQEQIRHDQIRQQQQMREQELRLQEDFRRRELERAEEIKLENIRNQQTQQLLKEQERQRQQQVENDSVTKRAPSAPWAAAASTKMLPSKMTLQDIQQQEALLLQKKQQEIALEQANTFNKTGWNTNTTTVNSSSSLSNIQSEEAKQRETQLQQQQHQQRESQRNEASSSQLKSLLGVNLANFGQQQQQQVPAGGWNTTAVPPKEKKSSLLDIMKEEVQHTGIAPNSTSPRPPVATTWASKAGSVSNSNWTSSTAVVNTAALKPTITLDTREIEKKELISPIQEAPKVVSPKPTSEKKSKASFGGSAMSGDMADWCSVQLKKINNSDDLTLVEFCMSLGSAVEIREYLAAYLGSTPQVSQFATEFIKRKDGKSSSMISSVSASDSRKTPMITVSKKKKG